ncbi:hypothetical protein H4219_002264 [Mycoemilia scoparia]|uniref:Glyoxylate reductase/hydroxypyruvate reductase n=1 Tax=Mycoemilia scoparia TaxID=417184 RepID=A0A9W8A7E6_9FUNG|nr:hypothetical protein H4219_002264 [Mycoemilia scoparia]
MSKLKPLLYVTRTLPQVAQKRLEALTEVEVKQWTGSGTIPSDELNKAVNSADGLLCMLTEKIDSALISSAGKQLKVISTMSVGYDHIDVQAAKDRQIALGYTPDVLTDATADLTALLALSAARRAKEAIDAVRDGKWQKWDPTWLLGSQFTGKTLGMVGLGRIGSAVASRLKPFGFSRVLYHGSQPRPERAEPFNAQFTSFDGLLSESDVICICCSLNEKTRHMFNKEAFKKMKSTAILVNTARGPIVQQDDLVWALNEREIAAVGTDVTDPEPIDPKHPLVGHSRAIVFPHIGSATEETRNLMANMAIDNALAGILGKDLKAPIK